MKWGIVLLSFLPVMAQAESFSYEQIVQGYRQIFDVTNEIHIRGEDALKYSSAQRAILELITQINTKAKEYNELKAKYEELDLSYKECQSASAEENEQ